MKAVWNAQVQQALIRAMIIIKYTVKMGNVFMSHFTTQV